MEVCGSYASEDKVTVAEAIASASRQQVLMQLMRRNLCQMATHGFGVTIKRVCPLLQFDRVCAQDLSLLVAITWVATEEAWTSPVYKMTQPPAFGDPVFANVYLK